MGGVHNVWGVGLYGSAWGHISWCVFDIRIRASDDYVMLICAFIDLINLSFWRYSNISQPWISQLGKTHVEKKELVVYNMVVYIATMHILWAKECPNHYASIYSFLISLVFMIMTFFYNVLCCLISLHLKFKDIISCAPADFAAEVARFLCMY